VAGDVAERLGRGLRGLFVLLGLLYKALPGVLGPCMILYGVSLVYAPAGFIVGGLFLLAIDRKVTWASGRAGRE
jgi:hypothetical protein